MWAEPVTALVQSAGPDARAEAPPGRAAGRHRIRRWLAAVVTFVAVYASVSTGIVAGAGACLLLVGILLAVPSSPHLSRRLALNGSLVFGWSPVLWWVHWPVSVNHGGAVLALGAAALAFLGVTSNRGPRAPGRVVPTCRAADLLIPLSGLAAFLVVSR